MPRSAEHASSREGLLEHEAATPYRRSTASDRSSSDSNANELDFLDDVSAPRPRGGWSKSPSRWKGKNKEKEHQGLPKTRRKGGLLRKKPCLLIMSILLGGLVGLIGMAAWVWRKAAPLDGQSPPWYPSPKGGTLAPWEESYRKAAVMVRKMSLLEKVNVTTGTGWSQDLCVGNTAPTSDAGFPPLCLQDGPLGIRFGDHATAWPAGITVGATWNKELMYKRGRGLGLEHRLKGINVLLGPSMGPLGRMPAGGRNWEGFGPDPVLQGIAAAETIKGIQDEGVMATAKHYVANEQEHFRQANEWMTPHAISSNIDDRTMHEVYLWPFADSIRVGVASVMCSYNMVNNSYACGNSKLLNGILKDELGFQGFVQSDWLAQRSGVASALAGLDMTMPGDGLYWLDGNSLFGPHLTRSVLNGSLPVERLDDMTTRIVAAWYQLGQDDKARWPNLPPEGDGRPNFSSWTNDQVGKIHHGSDDPTTAVVNQFIDVQGQGKDFHGRLAQRIAAEGTILVKNEDNVLPLTSIGWTNQYQPHGTGKYKVGIFGEDAGMNPKGPNACPDRGCNVGTLASGWGSGAVDFPYLVSPIEALQSSFDLDSVDITTTLKNDLPKDWDSSQDLCLVFINSDAGEGYITWEGITDRKDLYPQKGGDELVMKVAYKCSRTVVVVHAVGPVVLEQWVDLPNVKAIILANLPGEESGNAIADVLFGRVDASGRLPYTVGKSLSDYGPGGQIMYKPNGLAPQQDFKEGLLIDYRHYDHHSITPRYEFGFGLSYTTFTFSNLALTTLIPKSPFPSRRPDQAVLPPTYPTDIPDASSALFPDKFWKLRKRVYPYIDSTKEIKTGSYPYPPGYADQQIPSPAGGAEGGNPSLYDEHILVSVDLKNTGERTGKQVVQVYVSFPDNVVDSSTGRKIDFPVRVLRGFEKVEVAAGDVKTVEIRLTRKDLSYWSVGYQNWVIPDGDIVVAVGASSRDLPLSGTW